ncbi:DUF4350 domain-containing protein [Paenibacillus flagellatus]|uniref:Glutamine amidotransferase domain-containing protein n=1 Tax=Paenibacillus flagellatus TaxID=2211139 RepID=A0A2V5JXZ2_9BACL|nr:DUF4350 domain-containing protein [Paenibacillus flagellatus]PYI51735.1 hypothetical protein DLM86_22690 [Paenibacillus flagellatus]
MDNRIYGRSRWARWIGAALMVAVLWAAFAAAAVETAFAQKGPIDIVVEPGIDGKMKNGKWFPVKFTLTNKGDDVSGELAVRMTGDPNGGRSVVYAQHVDLPRQTTKVVWMTLPGKMMNANNNIVLFYDKGVDQGSPVPFSQGNVSIETKPISPETLFVGVVARDPDTLNFLSLLNQKGYQVQTVRLPIADFPWEATMLDGLDVIAFNDAPTDALKPEQAKQIAAWAERGGRLVLAGGAGYAKTAAAFGEWSPVTVSGTTAVTTLDEFARATGKELPLNGAFTVSSATVKDGETLYAEKGVPLIVEKRHGQGSITYVAYDLALQPVASWTGNPAIWERLLSGSLVSNGASRGPMGAWDNMWELNNALEQFPELVPPAYGVLTLLFLVYAIVVAPALYLVLKRIDRREWAWFAIPSIAVVTSVLIYAVGASDRGSTLAQTLAVNELSGTGSATRMAASSVFVPSGGDYEIEWSGKRSISPFMVNDGRTLQGGNADMIIRTDAERTVASFENVPFWSVRKAFGAQEAVSDAGKFDYSISIDASGVKGEVTNLTKGDLYEAGLFFGSQWVRIGDMKPGEKKPFQLSPAASPGMPGGDWGNYVFPYQGNRDMNQRERSLLNSYSQSKWNGPVNSRQLEPTLIGFAKSKEALFKIDGKPVASERIDMFVQRLKLDFVQGDRVFIPRGILTPFVETSNVTHMSSYFNGGIDVGKGDFTIVFRLPERKEWQFEKATLSMAQQPSFAVELWNESKQSWAPLQGGKTELTAEQLKEALTGGNGIRLKVTNSQNGGRFNYPDLTVEGAVKR